MDMHTATEVAYKNGYEAGYKAGMGNGLICCKDCTYWDETNAVGSKAYSNYKCICKYWLDVKSLYIASYTQQHDFCSHAEKK